MKLSEMIKVMQHYDKGGKVEYSEKKGGGNNWTTVTSPSWNWEDFEYQIKKSKQKGKFMINVLEEMIKVMKGYNKGQDVEFKSKNSNSTEWSIIKSPTWNWEDFDYQIKEPEQKVTIEKWLMQDTIDKEYRIIETSLIDSLINFKKVKLIESYEVKL